MDTGDVTAADQGPDEGLVTEIDWISDTLSASHTLLERYLERIGAVVDAAGATLALHVPSTGALYLRKTTGRVPGGLTQRARLADDALAAAAVEEGEPRRLDAPAEDPLWRRTCPECAECPGELSGVLVVPFRVGDVAGHLKLFRYGSAFEERDLRVTDVYAQQLGESLASARQVAEEQKRVAQLSTLTELAEMVNSSLDLAAVKAEAIEAVITLMGCEAASLLLLDETGQTLEFDVALGEKGAEAKRIRLDAGEGVAGWVVENGEHFLSNDVAAAPEHSKRVDTATGFVTRELFAVPLGFRGERLGCLQALNTRDGRGFSEEDLPVFEALANQVSVALVNARLFAELERRMEQIERQQEALIQSEKLSAMGQLSAGVAHEIRSPLSAISGYAQLIRRRFGEDAALTKPLTVIEDASSHINRIVNGLLDFSRKEEPRFEPISVHVAIEKALALAEHTLSRYKGVEVVLELGDDIPEVVADVRQLQQVFLNLMINAAQAMPSGGTLTLRTLTEPAPGDEGRIGRVVVLFEDTGKGIPEDAGRHIFQPFYTEGKERGTGLGLSICRSIVQNHRGSITFESEVGRGTTFRVQLPVDRPEE